MIHSFDLSTISIPLNLYFSLIRIYCTINNKPFNYKIENDDFNKLNELGFIQLSGNNITITNKGLSLVNNTFNLDMVAQLNKKNIDEDINNRITNLTEQMRNIFPSGLKDNKWYFRSNIPSVKDKLNTFFKKYGYNTYTDEQILRATQNYVNNFNGNSAGMSILKYFIEKKDHGSILIDYIEQLDNTEVNLNKIGNTNQII